MPRDIRYRSDKFLKPKFYLNIGLISALVIVIFLGAIFSKQWFPKINDLLIPAWQQTQHARPFSFLPTETQSTSKSTSTAISTAAEETQPTVTPNNTPTLTNTPPDTSEQSGQDAVLELDTPIGNQDKFIIHRAAVGESLGQYVSQYNTTIDAIRAVNSNLPSVLYIDQILVIPVDIVDVSNLPIFETYQVNISGLTVNQIVDQLSVATDAFRIYNNIPLNYIFNSGDWVLVPRQRP